MSCNPATGEERNTGCLASLSHAGWTLCRVQLQGLGSDGGGVGAGGEGWSEKGGSDRGRKSELERLGESGDGPPVRSLGTSSFLVLGEFRLGQRGQGRALGKASWQMVA